MTDAVLVLNVGSSSAKLALYALPGLEPLLRGGIERLGRGPLLRLGGGPAEAAPALAVPDLLRWLVGRVIAASPGVAIRAGGHRVVHGGREHAAPCVVTPEVRAGLAALSPLAPQHQPFNLAGIDALSDALPGLPQVACFDTAFHRTQPRLAQLYALPRALADEGVLRYGFHGLSYSCIAGMLPEHLGARADGRVVVAHLGQGASLCAMANRQSVATTMGFTVLDGLMMGRRSGAVDPGLVLHLIRGRGMSPEAVEEMLTRQSGLLGVSGESDDLRDLLASGSGPAREAVALFCRTILLHVGAMAMALGGLDALVFTAGIGANSAEVRAEVAAGLGWLGAALDADANARNRPVISTPESRVTLLCLPTDEERVIAAAVRDLAFR